jgi:hypothetical protein
MVELDILYGDKMGEIVCNSDACDYINRTTLRSISRNSPNISTLKSTIPIHFAIKVDRRSIPSIEIFLLNEKSIVSVHKLEFGFDFLVQGLFLNIHDAESFFMMLLENFNILDIKKYYVLKSSVRK